MTKQTKTVETESDIPDFLKRNETPEQADARRAKNKPVDASGGLKVKPLPVPPPPAVAKAIAKDLGKLFPTDHGDEAMVGAGKPPTAAEKTGTKNLAHSMSDKDLKWQIRNAKKLGIPDALNQTFKTELAARTAKPAPKKAGSLVERALKARDALNAKAASAKSAKPATNAKKPAKPSAPKKSGAKRAVAGKYDWDKAAAIAKTGKLPPLPPFNSYKPHIKDFHDLAVKKDVKGIRDYSATFVDEKGARANMFRYRDLLLVALKH